VLIGYCYVFGVIKLPDKDISMRSINGLCGPASRSLVPLLLALLLTGCVDSGSKGNSTDSSEQTEPVNPIEAIDPIEPDPIEPEPDPIVLSPPAAPELALTPMSIKTFQFSWPAVDSATEYRLLEDADSLSGYTPVATLEGSATDHALEVFLPGRINARYMLQACNTGGCSTSEVVHVEGALTEAIGYLKASNAEEYDQFGFSVALSADGATLAVGANLESTGSSGSGAVYVFSRTDDTGDGWIQQAFLKAPNAGVDNWFGWSVALSADGATLAVGAPREDSDANDSGAVYVFNRTDNTDNGWSEPAFVKASTVGVNDRFGTSVALSGDGATLAVGLPNENGNAGAVYVFTRTDGTDNVWGDPAFVKAMNASGGHQFGSSVVLSADGATLAVGAWGESTGGNNSGAAYVFTRTDDTVNNWIQQAYLKASTVGAGDQFGARVALSADGATLAVGAPGEDSDANNSGAVYVFTRTDDIGNHWIQQAYLKASTVGEWDQFGWRVALSADGATLAVGARFEGSDATGINGQAVGVAENSGAVYVFIRTNGVWSQQAYVKASNTSENDWFGFSLALSGDGATLAVGALLESSNAKGINNLGDGIATYSGAVYLY